MILYLFGKDTFRSRAQLHKMMEKFRADRDPQGLNIVRLDASTEPTGKVLEQILVVPFLAEKRMVIVEKALSGAKETCAALLERVKKESIPDSTVLVFWEDTETFRTKDAKELHAVLSSLQFAQQFDLLSGVLLAGWISQEVLSRGGSIDPRASGLLAAQIGNDMWRLHSLIDQLVSYTDGHQIQSKDIQTFVPERIDDNIFNLIDAIIGKLGKQVFTMIEEQYRIGKDPGYIFAMLLRQYRILLELRDMFDRDDTMQSDVLAKKLGLHPFVVKKSLPLVKRYTKNQLLEVYEQLLTIDVEVKKGANDQGMLVDVFVGRQVAVG